MQYWNQLCDEMNGQLHTARVWHMFRALLGQTKPRHALQRYELQTGCTMKDLIKEIRDTFYPAFDPQPIDIPAANTSEDTGINSSFTHAELQMALQLLRRNTAPGPDKITFRHVQMTQKR